MILGIDFDSVNTEKASLATDNLVFPGFSV